MRKKILIGLVIAASIIGGGVYMLLNNLDYFVKSAIENYGSAVTGVAVKVGNVHISTSSGEGSISELTIANPGGYGAPYAFQMGKIALSIDTGSLFGSRSVVIREIEVDSPQVTFEMNDNLSSNLQGILQHVKGASPRASNPAANPAHETAAPGAPKPERKIIISDLTIKGGQIHITSDLLKDKAITAPLSTVHLTDIGKDSDGATPAEATKEVLVSVLSAAMNDAEAQLAMGKLKSITDKLK